MKLTLKTTVIAASLGLFSLTAPAISYADHHGQKMDHAAPMGKPSEAFMENLHHSSFMPNLMRQIMMNKTALELDKKQLMALKGYNQENSPKVQTMVGELMKLEAKAQQMALKDATVEAVSKVGNESIQLRQDLMKAKLKCREFVKGVLNSQQYQQVLMTYK